MKITQKKNSASLVHFKNRGLEPYQQLHDYCEIIMTWRSSKEAVITHYISSKFSARRIRSSSHASRACRYQSMETIYDEIEIEDFTFDPTTQLLQYPCPCGDKFAIALDDLNDGEDIAVCPSCSLMVRVIFEAEDLQEYYEQIS